MKQVSKSRLYLIIGVLLVIVIFVFIYIKLSKQTILEQGDIFCRRSGQRIAIGFNEENIKCCKGLDAVIETRSNVRCLIHSESQGTADSPRYRVSKFEQ